MAGITRAIAVTIALTTFSPGLAQGDGREPRKIIVGVGNFQPFFDPGTESGIFWDLVKNIFSKLPQYEVSYRAMSNRRLVEELNNGRLDVAANISAEQSIQGFKSAPIFRYASIAGSRKGLSINGISDLHDLAVVTWQGASKVYGPEFARLARTSQRYRELPNVNGCVVMVVKRRADACIIDRFLFLHFLRQSGASARDFTLHNVMNNHISLAGIGFRTKEVRDDVDGVIAAMTASGELEAVYERYLTKLSAD